MNQLNLIRKIREYRPDPHLPISADDIKKYRERLLQHDHLTDAEEEEMRITANWLYQLDLPYKVPESPDLKKTVRLCCGFTDEIFLSILPDLCNLWTYSTHMVALYHTMIYDGWMCPVVFRYWVGWFNEHVEEIGLPDKKMSDDTQTERGPRSAAEKHNFSALQDRLPDALRNINLKPS